MGRDTISKMKLYDKIRELLVDYPALRDSDKKLMWALWWKLGLLEVRYGKSCIDREMFYKAPASESVTRARRKIQEDHPELGSSTEVARARKEKEEMGGMFVYHEKV